MGAALLAALLAAPAWAACTWNYEVVPGGLADIVGAGQEACNTTIVDGGEQIVKAGGTATGTIIYGEQRVSSGGTATNTTINYGGAQVVDVGGTATNTTINYGGVQFGAGVATTINGGDLLVGSRDTATDTTMAGADSYLEVKSGGTLDGTLTFTGGGNRLLSAGTFNISAYVFSASALSTATPVLIVDTRSTTTPALGGATINISGPVPPLALGDTFTLISRVSGTPTPTSISVGDYEFALSVSTGGSLIAQVTGVPTYSVNIDPGITDGSITGCNPLTVEHGTTLSITCTTTPDAGYILTSLTLTDSTGNTATCNATTCDLANVQGDVTVTGRFQKDNYNITDLSDRAEGRVTCDRNPVPYGESTRCDATPATGHVFDGTMSVTGATLGACDATGCELTNATGAVTVTGQFSKEMFAITDASDPAEGSITCTPNPVPYGETVTCTATPAPGYELSGVSSSGGVSWTCDPEALTCTSSAITSALSVSATFTQPQPQQPYVISDTPTMGEVGLLLSGIALAGAAAPALRRREKQGKKTDTRQ
ncbi:MAG: AIDA repeat-containing protein [Ottowia sp.]|nr:AIDA repeat-containing protein [Ottowia sp.]